MRKGDGKDFSLSLEMTMRKDGILPPSPAQGRPEGDVRGMAALFLRHSPSFLWKEVPRRGGGWLPRNKKKWVEAFPRFVIPNAAEGSFSFTVSGFLRKAA